MFLLLLILSLGVQLHQTRGKTDKGRGLRKRSRWWPLAEAKDDNVVLRLKAFFEGKSDYWLLQAQEKNGGLCMPMFQSYKNRD